MGGREGGREGRIKKKWREGGREEEETNGGLERGGIV